MEHCPGLVLLKTLAAFQQERAQGVHSALPHAPQDVTRFPQAKVERSALTLKRELTQALQAAHCRRLKRAQHGHQLETQQWPESLLPGHSAALFALEQMAKHLQIVGLKLVLLQLVTAGLRLSERVRMVVGQRMVRAIAVPVLSEELGQENSAQPSALRGDFAD